MTFIVQCTRVSGELMDMCVAPVACRCGGTSRQCSQTGTRPCLIKLLFKHDHAISMHDFMNVVKGKAQPMAVRDTLISGTLMAVLQGFCQWHHHCQGHGNRTSHTPAVSAAGLQP